MQPIYVLVKFVSRSVPILSLVFSMGVTTILTEGVVVPLLCPIVYFLTTDAQIAIIVFFVTALICAELDLKEIANVHRASVPKFVNPAISVLFFPPLYVYSRSQFAGVKSSNRWGWFLVYIAIALSCIPAVGALAYSKELKVDACELMSWPPEIPDSRCILK